MSLSIAAFLRYFITYIRSILLTYTGTHNIPLCIACLRRVTLGFFLLKPWVAVPGIAGMGWGCFQHSGQIAPLGSHLSPRQWTGLGQNRAVSWKKRENAVSLKQEHKSSMCATWLNFPSFFPWFICAQSLWHRLRKAFFWHSYSCPHTLQRHEALF